MICVQVQQSGDSGQDGAGNGHQDGKRGSQHWRRGGWWKYGGVQSRYFNKVYAVMDVFVLIWDKTMDDKLIYIPNNYKITPSVNHIMVEKLGHS